MTPTPHLVPRPDRPAAGLCCAGAPSAARALALAPLSACAGPTGAPGPGTLTLGLNRSLVSLDNKLNQFDAAVTVQRAVRQALTWIGPDLKPRLVLAERFEMTAPTAWTVRLREGVRYSDGSPVTVEDVDTALQMYARSTARSCSACSPSCRPSRPQWRAELPPETQRPVPMLDLLMANILITPAEANRPEELRSGSAPGPYRVVSANGGTGEYTLARNTEYWGKQPPVDKVRVRFVPEESSRVIALRSGELDVMDTLTPDSAEQLAGLPGVAVAGDPRRPDQPALLQLPQTQRASARRRARAPRADLRDRRRGPDTRRPHRLRRGRPREWCRSRSRGGAHGHVRLRPAQGQGAAQVAGRRGPRITIMWESGEFAGDTSVMEAVVDMLKDVGVRASAAAVRARRQHPASGGRDAAATGTSSATASPARPARRSPSLQGMYGGTPRRNAPATPTRATSSRRIERPALRRRDRDGRRPNATRTARRRSSTRSGTPGQPVGVRAQDAARAPRPRPGPGAPADQLL